MTTNHTHQSSKTSHLISALGVGILFALGLGVSGMTQPGKVIGFLDFFGGSWDPSLAFVMGGGVLVYMMGYPLAVRRDVPVFASKFLLPTRRDIDRRLILGSLLFGAGWGLGGYCPGPAMTSLPTFSTDVLVFAGSMFGGMLLYAWFDHMLSKKPSSPDRSTSPDTGSAVST